MWAVRTIDVSARRVHWMECAGFLCRQLLHEPRLPPARFFLPATPPFHASFGIGCEWNTVHMAAYPPKRQTIRLPTFALPALDNAHPIPGAGLRLPHLALRNAWPAVAAAEKVSIPFLPAHGSKHSSIVR